MLSQRRNNIVALVVLVLLMLVIFSSFTRFHKRLDPFSFIREQSMMGQLPASVNDHHLSSKDSHNKVFSVSRPDGKYWPIDFDGVRTINPNILPHPNKTGVFIIVAARANLADSSYSLWCVEITCEASFHKGSLKCIDKPEILPISATYGGNCQSDLGVLNLNIGPHDARVFYGPDSPYIIYGSNSHFTCFGQWMQDFRMLVNWPAPLWMGYSDKYFIIGKELQKLHPTEVEKNWFIFWDSKGDMYLHYDLAPHRSFAKMEKNGTISVDVAPLTATHDERCMAAYAPHPGESESIHQGTNSLAIVICQKTDPGCSSTEDNTYVMHIYHHKFWHGFHGVYEPYVILMHRTAPFGIYGMTKRPFWVHGRGEAGFGKFEEFRDQSEMIYVTSMNWRERGRNYAGYLDDVLLLGFGVEDKMSAVMDVRAGDLLNDLGLCSELERAIA